MRIKAFASLLCVSAIAVNSTIRREYGLSNLESPKAIEEAFLTQSAPAASRQSLQAGQDSVGWVDNSADTSGVAGQFGGIPAAAGAGYSVGLGGTDHDHVALSEDVTKFEHKIGETKQEIFQTKAQLREAKRCAMRVVTLQAKLKALEDKKDRLEVDKKKKILQGKLDRQQKDLNDIDRMADALREKFGELRRTQNVIRDSIDATRGSIQGLVHAAPSIPGDGSLETSKNMLNTFKITQEGQLGEVTEAKDLDKQRLLNMLKSVLATGGHENVTLAAAPAGS